MNYSPHRWKEARRIYAWHLKQQGWTQRQVATPPPRAPTGVCPGAESNQDVCHQIKGVELRHLCCLNTPHPQRAWCNAVKRLRRKPRLIQSFFRGARR